MAALIELEEESSAMMVFLRNTRVHIVSTNRNANTNKQRRLCQGRARMMTKIVIF
jgi:hypothetical protein